MNEIDRLLEKIRRTPLLIGVKSLSSLVAFLDGYVYRMVKKEAKICEVLPGFQEFITKRYGGGKRHWSFAIESQCSSGEEAFDKFYELLDEFYSTNGNQPKLCLYKTPDIEVLLEFSDIATKREYACGNKRFECQVASEYALSGYFRVSLESSSSINCSKNRILKGTFSFDFPENCPKHLWIGKTFDVFDDTQVVGLAIVTDIYNPVLLE